MSAIKFSIVTMAYNAEHEINETMLSVLKQDYRPIEYIVVDGGSTDGSNNIIENIISEYSTSDIEIKYKSEPDQGISDAFNKGIAKSTGDVIGLINAGDQLMPGALKKKAAFLNDSVDIVYGKTLFVDKTNHLKYLRQIPDHLDISKIKYNGLIFTHQSAFVKKKIYAQYGLYDTSFKYVMDTELFANFVEHGVKFFYIDEVLVSMLAGGISSRPSLALVKENIRVAEKYGGYSKKKIYARWIMRLPRYYIVCCLKKFSKIWLFLIGKRRAMGYDS